MPFPADTAPLYRAVVAAMTTETGQVAALTASKLYVLARPEDFQSEANAGTIFRRPKVWVEPIHTRPIDPQLRLTDRNRVEATVRIHTYYFAHETHTTEWQTTMARIDRDRVLVGEALTYPGALLEDPDGNPTGLDGGSLRMDDGRWAPDGPTQTRKDRVWRLTHVFRAGVELAR
jgi:hypothetical protein